MAAFLSRTLFLLAFLFIAPTTKAHPSVSIVIDSQGRIFYSDLTHVWVIHPDGRKEIAVNNVHTHELWLDEKDVLYGEDVQNLSGNRVRHKVWARTPDGTITDHIGWRSGYPEDYADYAFNIDQQGYAYILRKAEKQIDVRKDEAVARTISLAGYDGYIHWLTVDPAGTVYIAIGDALYQAHPGEASLARMADNLIERTPEFDFLHDRHAIMGIWPGNDNDVFVSIYAGQVLKRVSSNGTVTNVAHAKGKWSIAGGTFTEDNIMYLLEFSSSNEARVRRILPDGQEDIL